MYSAEVVRFLTRTVLCFALLVPLGCRGPTLPAGSTDPIIIGAVLPLSGELGGDGERYRDAMLLAVREANAAGGPIAGRRVELRVADSETDPEIGAREAARLIREGAVAILGDASSASTLRIYEDVTAMERVPQISCTSTSPLLSDANMSRTEADRFFFRTAPSDVLQARVVVDIATNEAACSRLAILHIADGYGMPLGEEIERLYEAGGGTVSVRVPFALNRPDYNAEVDMVRAASPDCIALVAYPPAAGLIVRRWNTLEPTSVVDFIGTDALNSVEFVTEAGSPTAIDGFYGTVPLTTPETPQFNAFADRLRAVYGVAPQPFQSSCYDAAAMLMLAIADAGDTDGEMVRGALRRLSDPAATDVIGATELDLGLSRINAGRVINYVGASGPVDFDALGDVLSDYEIWRFEATGMSFARVRIVRSEELL